MSARFLPEWPLARLLLWCLCAIAALVTCLVLAARIAQGASQTSQALELVSKSAVVDSSLDSFDCCFFPTQGYAVTGVSDDARIVGMVTQEQPSGVVMDIDMALRQAGWIALPVEQEGLYSYQRGDPVQEAPYTGVTYVMLVVEEYRGKTSVLVQLV